jgi:hypothetical protein
MKDAKPTPARTWLTFANGAWLAAYLLAMSAVVWGLAAARQSALANFATPEAREDWNDFRAEMNKQTSDPERSVTRRVLRGDEPPTLRLLRDYFAVCLALALLLCSALFATLMVMIRGALIGNRFEPIDD